MTSKADLPALGAFLRDLGGDIERTGELAWDRSKAWENEQIGAAGEDELCVCGHTATQHHHDTGPCMFVRPATRTPLADPAPLPCTCMNYAASTLEDPAAADRREEAKRVALAAMEHVAYTRAVGELDRAAQEVRRRHDRICPPDPRLAHRNKRTGEADPETAAEVALAGYCSNCWRNDQQMVPITMDKRTGKPIFRDLCEWCGRAKAEYGILPDLPLLRIRHAGGRVTQKDWDAALARAKAQQGTGKKGKRKKGRLAA